MQDSFAQQLMSLLVGGGTSPQPTQPTNPYGYPMGPYKGLFAFGNVDPLNRPVLHNPDGSYSTSSTATEFDPRDQTATIFPTVIGGKRMSTADAWASYLATGQHMGKFKIDDPNNNAAWGPSDAYATSVHNWQASHYDPTGKRIR